MAFRIGDTIIYPGGTKTISSTSSTSGSSSGSTSTSSKTSTSTSTTKPSTGFTPTPSQVFNALKTGTFSQLYLASKGITPTSSPSSTSGQKKLDLGKQDTKPVISTTTKTSNIPKIETILSKINPFLAWQIAKKRMLDTKKVDTKIIPSLPTEEEVLGSISTEYINKQIRGNKNTRVRMTWEDASGKITTTNTKLGSLNQSQQNIIDAGGRILKITDINKRTTYFQQPSSEEWKIAYGKEYDKYIKTEVIPAWKQSGYVEPWFKEQMKFPEGIKESGLGQQYTNIAYSQYLGLTSKEKAQMDVNALLRTSPTYLTTYAKWGEDGKSWSQLKKEEPALSLKYNISTGEYKPEMDYEKWYKERKQQYYDTGKGGAFEVGQFSKAVLSVFDPSTYVSAYKGTLAKDWAKSEYEAVKGIHSGKGLEVWAGLQAPAYQNVILPMLGGAVIGKAVGLVGKAGTSLLTTATTTGGKALGTSMAYFPYAVGGAFTGVAVSSNITTYQLEQAGKLPEGSTMKSLIGTSMQIGSAVAGYKLADYNIHWQGLSKRGSYSGIFSKQIGQIKDWGSTKLQGWETRVGESYARAEAKYLKPLSSKVGLDYVKTGMEHFKLSSAEQSFNKPTLGKAWMYGEKEPLTYRISTGVRQGLKDFGVKHGLISDVYKPTKTLYPETWEMLGYRTSTIKPREGWATQPRETLSKTPQNYEYQFYKDYTPTTLELHQEAIALRDWKLSHMPGHTNIATETKVILNPANPYEAKFISTSNKELLKGFDLTKLKYETFEKTISPENILRTSKLVGEKPGDFYTLGKMRTTGFEGKTSISETSGITYYKLNYAGKPEVSMSFAGKPTVRTVSTGDVFFQESPFIGKAKTIYGGELKGWDMSLTTGVAVPLKEVPISFTNIYAGKSVTVPASWGKTYGSSVWGTKPESGIMTWTLEPVMKDSIMSAGLSFSKNIAGHVKSVGKYGLSEFIEGDLTTQKTFGLYRGIYNKNIGGRFTDVATIFQPEFKGGVGSLALDKSGFSYKQPGFKITSDLIMPGGVGLSGLQTKIQYPVIFPKMVTGGRTKTRYSLDYLESLEYGIQPSGYWSDIAPSIARQKTNLFIQPKTTYPAIAITGLKLGLGQSLKPQTNIKQGQILKSDLGQGLGLINISLTKQEQDYTLLPKSALLSDVGLKTETILGLKQDQKLETVSLLKTEELAIQKPIMSPTSPIFITTPKFPDITIPDFTIEPPPPIVTPPPPPRFQFGGEPIKPHRKWSWQFGSGKPGKRYLVKTVLSDPFSVSHSLALFGKATHPIPTKSIWELGERTWWKIPTVELMQEKKSKKKKNNKIKLNLLRM